MVLIITLNYNKSKETITCVKTILQSDYKEFTILLIDNGSELKDYEALFQLQDDRIKIRRIEKNCGYVGGINYGLRASHEFNPEYILIMNNDTIIGDTSISELVKTAKKHNNNCIVSGKTYNLDEPNTLQYIGQRCQNHNTLSYPSLINNFNEKDIGQFDNEMEMDMLDDMFWLLPFNVFEKVGYYCSYFFLSGEQNDYAMRAKKAGVKLIYTPNAKLWHHHHLTTSAGERGNSKLYYWQGFGFLLLGYLHLSKYHFFMLYMSLLLKYTIKSVGAFVFLKYSKYKEKYEPYLLAQWYFSLWLFKKTENDGYNPYNKK